MLYVGGTDFNGNVYISFLPASETSNVASHSWLSS